MDQFGDAQRRYYLTEIGRSAPGVRPSDVATMQAALGITDPTSAGAPAIGPAATLVSDFGRSSTVNQREQQCRAIQVPGASMRAPDARTGCGWWYVPDPNRQSTGAYGTRRGPMMPNLDTQFGTGRWVWDPQEAAQLEASKHASKIQSCEDLALSQWPNMGWCPGTGRAIPLNSAGGPMYPQAPGGDCPGGGIITNAAQCSVPSAPGGPPAGGSNATGGTTGLCQPNGSGALSPGCLRSVTNMTCSANGVLSQSLGGGSYAGTDPTVAAANAYLQQRGFTIHSGILNDGRVSMTDAMKSVAALRQIANTTDGSRAASAAANLCFGSPFDPCQIAPTDVGPYPSECVEKLLTSLGWGAQGTLRPSNGGAQATAFWNQQANWQAVKNQAVLLKSTADKMTTPQAQAAAIGQVYGASVKYPKSGCNNTGIALYRHYFPTWNQSLFQTNGPVTHFLGRYIFREGFPNSPSTVEDQTPAGGNLTEGQRYITQFVPTQGGAYSFLATSDDGMRILIQGPSDSSPQLVMNWHPCCGPPGSFTYTFEPGQVYTIMVDMWNGGGPWAFVLTYSVNGSPPAPLPAAQLSLPVDRRFPVLEWNFAALPQGGVAAGIGATVTDTNKIFKSTTLHNAPIGQIAGQKCMLVNYPNRVASSNGGYPSGLFNIDGLVQGMRVRAIKSFSMLLFLNQVNYNTSQGSVAPTVFSLYNVPSSNPTAFPRQFDPSMHVPMNQRKDAFSFITNGAMTWPDGVGKSEDGTDIHTGYYNNAINGHMGVPNTPLGQWFHYAFVWDDDFRAFTCYVNGTQAARAFVPAFDIRTMCELMTIGCDNHPEGAWWSGGIAWFRGFDYRLSQDQIETDMKDAWATVN